MSEDTNVNADLDNATAILEPMIANGASHEEMVVALIQSGIKYARAGRLMTKVLEAKGLRVSAKDRYAAAAENLTNWGFAPASWDDVEDAVANLVEELDATNAAQALSCVKRFAKDHEIELPEKPKSSGGPRNSVYSRFFDWALVNREATDAEAEAFVMAQVSNERQGAKYAAICVPALQFARAFRA